MRVIILLGPPGVVKGTQATRIKDLLSLSSFSTGDLLRQAKESGSDLGQQVAQYIDSGQLVPDDVVLQVVADELDSPRYAKGCLLDGFPRTVAQAEALDRYLHDRREEVDLVLELRADTEELVRRILKRAEIEGRADDTLETVQRRMQVYHAQTAPLVAYYEGRGNLRSIDGEGTPEEVSDRIRETIQQHFPQQSPGS
jgi:adenylate kinase